MVMAVAQLHQTNGWGMLHLQFFLFEDFLGLETEKSIG